MEFATFIAWVGGLFVGSLVTRWLQSAKSATGVLRIDRNNPEKESYKLEVDNLDELAVKTQLVLKIDNNATLSQD